MLYRIYFSRVDGVGLSPIRRIQWWLIRCLSLSRIVHCDIGCNGAVLNVALVGNSYWPEHAYLKVWPGIDTIIEVDGKVIDLSYFQNRAGVRLRGWPTFWRWLRRGEGPYTHDCLCTVLLCLEAAGIPVPTTITTPAELCRWLKQKGYPYVRIRPDAARRHRSSEMAG